MTISACVNFVLALTAAAFRDKMMVHLFQDGAMAENTRS
jgi:hypothetical protein